MSAANVARRWLQRAYPAAWILALGGERQTTFALNNPRVSHLLCCCSFDTTSRAAAADSLSPLLAGQRKRAKTARAEGDIW